MIQTAQTLPQHFTKLDTLQNQVKQLNHLVDSLKSVSASTTIGTNYFHDIIGGVIMIFILIITIIVTVAGLINWNVVLKRFKKMTNDIKNELENKIKDNEEKFEKLTSDLEAKIKQITDDNIKLQINVRRAMFFTQKTDDPTAATVWGLAVVDSLLDANDLERATAWLNMIKEIADRITKEDLKRFFVDCKKQLSKLTLRLKDDHLKVLGEIEDKIYFIMYSPDPES
jgi:putative sterol carrier protein